MPNIGDKKSLGPCKSCGEELFSTWREISKYHNDSEDAWIPPVHTMHECIRFLVSRIKNLETAVKQRASYL